MRWKYTNRCCMISFDFGACIFERGEILLLIYNTTIIPFFKKNLKYNNNKLES